MTEPSDAEVEAIIERHPSGCTLDQIAAVLGVTRARAQQIVQEAISKVVRHCAARGIRRVSDVLG